MFHLCFLINQFNRKSGPLTIPRHHWNISLYLVGYSFYLMSKSERFSRWCLDTNSDSHHQTWLTLRRTASHKILPNFYVCSDKKRCQTQLCKWDWDVYKVDGTNFRTSIRCRYNHTVFWRLHHLKSMTTYFIVCSIIVETLRARSGEVPEMLEYRLVGKMLQTTNYI